MKGDYTLKGRELFGVEVWQKTKDSYFCLTDLVNAGNEYRRKNGKPLFNITAYLNQKNTKEFIQELELKYNTKAIKKGSAKKSKSWGHPLLFIDMALAIDPKLKIEVYEWIMDELVKYRVKSGSKYNIMCGVIFENMGDKSKFQKGIKFLAKKIKEVIRCDDWDRATEKQLEHRDYLCTLIADFTDINKDPNRGYITAIELYKRKLARGEI